MNNVKSTKRALLFSLLALVVCITMLIGSTFAWFTDSVSNVNNTIKSGNLDVVMEYSTDGTTWNEVTANASIFDENALWEPGYANVVALRVRNVGSLALKYNLSTTVYSETASINVYGDEFKLSDYIVMYGKRTDGGDPLSDAMMQAYLTNPVAWQFAENDRKEFGKALDSDAMLLAGATQYYIIAAKMPTNVGNEANHKTGVDAPTIKFGIDLLATQYTQEKDGYGSNQYDKDATYPFTDTATLEDGQTAVELQVRDENESKMGTAIVPAEAVAEDAEGVTLEINKSAYKANIAIDTGVEKAVYDVKVTGLKENNTTLITVELRIPAGLDPQTVKVYHYETLIDSRYDAATGYVTFKTASFSPFTVLFDAESEYEAPEVDKSKLPTATVVNSPEYENVDIAWGSYGQWSPTKGLDSKLEAAYTFTCDETLEQAKNNPYANWYCDFYVSLNKDLGENQIFLGGNYGIFKWVGFHNGDLTLKANTEIPLLGSVTTTPWTYLDVVDNVGEFICGVGDVNNALSGATFTVKLRLTNPENENDFVDVETITYTFK